MLLRTSRLSLRPFSDDDADLLFALDTDPEVLRWINGGRALSADEILRVSVPRLISQTDAARGVGFWTASKVRPSGSNDLGEEPIGWFHLKPPRLPPGSPESAWNFMPGEIEIGSRLLRRVWNRGLATEGARALIGFAFESLGAPRVVACTMLGNASSRRVMEKLGMKPDGEFLEDRWPLEDKRAIRYAIRPARS